MTKEQLKELLSYNKETGIFTWITKTASRSNRIKIGEIAGSLDHSCGYIKIQINNKSYRAHRLAWLYEYGKWPDKDLDHINHNPSDNRLCNLREVTHRENHMNKAKRKANTSGVTGVCWCKDRNKWMAQISIDGKNNYLGYFDELECAIKVRKEAEAKYGYHVNHGIDVLDYFKDKNE